MCPQPSHNNYKVSEDCLFVNVYSHSLLSPSDERKKLLPVIVYIHPGVFMQWSGTSEHHAGPEYLMDREVILVTINYRLGTLGFLATGTADSPGNYGLKDQVLVLEWIRDYIENFGGDPNSVTIMGYSCGGVSGTLHMVSPRSRGEYGRRIMIAHNAANRFHFGRSFSSRNCNERCRNRCIHRSPRSTGFGQKASANIQLPRRQYRRHG